MSRSPDHPEREPAEELPARLSGDLRETYAGSPGVPPAFDEAILQRARQQLGAPHRHPALAFIAALAALAALLRCGPASGWRSLQRPMIAAAATASLILALRVGFDSQRAGAPHLSEDLDGNGLVDIGDAFFLARALAGSSSPRTEWDVNGDGIVGRGDVDTIARAAVRLSRSDEP